MIGTALNRGSEARDSKVSSLAFFLSISVLIHGVFFPQEWLWLGAGLAFALSWEAWRRVKIYGSTGSREIQGTLSITDGLLFLLIALSLFGLWHPVKSSEGWMDAIRWGTLWMVYHKSSTIASGREQGKMLSWIERIGILLAILAWLSQLSLWAQGQEISLGQERLSSLFGYPNALGVYLAAALLLSPRSKPVQALFLITLINTGSRAVVFLFLFVLAIRGWIRWRAEGILPGLREGAVLGLILISSLILTIGLNPGALQHLLDWGVQNSLGERLIYIQDGLRLAWANRGMPEAGGWLAFPTIQNIPYWTTDPHSLWIRVLLNQGVLGLAVLILWVILIFRQFASRSRMKYEEGKNQGIFWALLFLGLHAAIDADFLFGTLGILFWILLGMGLPRVGEAIDGKGRLPALRAWRKPGFRKLKNIFQGLLFIFSGLAFLGAWVYPQGPVLSVALDQELVKMEGNKQHSLEILEDRLSKDQTQFEVRREIASLELELKGAAGLEAAEHVLSWEKYNVRTYEWIQGRVLEEAEKRRSTDPSEALLLYRWCANLPMRLEKVAAVSPFEQRVWLEASNFKASDLMKLLAATAKERQLTLL